MATLDARFLRLTQRGGVVDSTYAGRLLGNYMCCVLAYENLYIT